MIDPSKCEFEESVGEPCDAEWVFYFTYPKDFTEAVFEPEENYGNVFAMCVAVALMWQKDRYDYCMMMSPIVEDGDDIIDADWVDLDEGRNYTRDTVEELLKIAGLKEVPLI